MQNIKKSSYCISKIPLINISALSIVLLLLRSKFITLLVLQKWRSAYYPIDISHVNFIKF